MTITVELNKDQKEPQVSTCCAPLTPVTPVEEVRLATAKEVVRDKYGAIAREATTGCGCGCGTTAEEASLVGDAYTPIEGYVADADLGLGCGIPTEHAAIEEGHTVLDLGSGAGIDAFVARSLVGPSGRVIGVDMTPEMVERALINTQKLGFENVDFYEGDIEALPLPDDLVDVIVSNCVLNLVPDKPKAFSEMYRVLKPGAHFCISDIVLRAELPDTLKRSAELYAGCVSGAMLQDDYLNLLEKAGFSNIQVRAERVIDLPDAVLLQFASQEQIDAFRATDNAIVSITVYGEKGN